MRVLFVCSDADVGGAERLLAMLGAHWDKTDRLRLVVLMSRGSLSDELENAFDEVTYLEFSPASRNLFSMVNALERQVADFKPDVISSHLFHADLVTAVARTKVPKTTTIHTHGLSTKDHWLTRVVARVVGVLSFRFSVVIPSSDSEDMARFVQSLHMKNVTTAILNGTKVPEHSSFDSRSRTFLSLARSHPVKGHEILFKAFGLIAEDLPDWNLRAVGPGVTEDDPTMRKAIEAAGVADLISAGRIFLEGPTTSPYEMLSGSAALIISSLYGETSPLVGAEAAGAGVPVITTRVGNCVEFADDPRFIVTPGSSWELARALTTFAGLNDAERIELSTIARQRALLKYRAEDVVAKYRGTFLSLVTSRNET